MHSARQVWAVKALGLLVCAGGLCTLCANAGQHHLGPWPLPESGKPQEDAAARDRMLRQLQPEQPAETPPRGYRKSTREITCTVLGWTPTPMPTLHLTCPSKGVLSPIRLYFHMSWESPEKAPTRAEDVVAQPGMPAKLRLPITDKAGKTAAAVKLPTRRNGQGRDRKKWFTFDFVAFRVDAD